jgi:hypothetical protein
MNNDMKDGIDRRAALVWAGALAAAIGSAHHFGFSLSSPVKAIIPGYGTDPDMLNPVVPWERTLSETQLAAVRAFVDFILPREGDVPSASDVGVHDLIDEWISAPYPQQRADREIILPGLAWVDTEAQSRFGQPFAKITDAQRAAIADAICSPGKAAANAATAAKFFARFRDLTAGGFYTTPVGMKDIGYVGNVPLERFDGPPPELLRKLGLG